MRVLPDTHAFLWWVTGDHRLSSKAREIIADGSNTLFPSAASGWEMAIKASLGKLKLPADVGEFVAEQLYKRPTGSDGPCPVRLACLPATVTLSTGYWSLKPFWKACLS